MNEHELLELAAKAAGYKFRISYTWCEEGESQIEVVEPWGRSYKYWNPLKDDGDALRLAVKLGMRISAYSNCVVVDTDYGLFDESADLSDLYAATRLAITRAAAETGRDCCE